MVSPQPVLLAVAADGRELAGFSSREPADAPVRWAYWSQWSYARTLIVADGIGRESARRAIESALVLDRPRALLSIGYVGALRPGWSAGDIFLADRILLLGAGLEYAGTLPVFEAGPVSVRRGALATIDHIAGTVAEKRSLAAQGADAVDMEAFEVAAQAEKLGVPFFCVRVVSDDAETELGFDFDRARRPDGTVSGAAVAAQAGLSPARWRKLLELKRNGELAARNLAQFLLRCRFPLESNL